MTYQSLCVTAPTLDPLRALREAIVKYVASSSVAFPLAVFCR